MPLAALEKIVASLNSEPVPPPDGMVEPLLDTAGLTQLLERYRAAHQHSEDRA